MKVINCEICDKKTTTIYHCCGIDFCLLCEDKHIEMHVDEGRTL